jgi:hypothetical protein
MRIPYLNRPTVNKITGKAIGTQRDRADGVIKAMLREIPELIAITIVEVRSGRTLSAYTSTKAFDPYKASGPNVQLVNSTFKNLMTPGLTGQALDDITVVLNNQLHCLRPMNDNQWYCYLAVGKAETNLAIVKDIMRRCTR